MQKTVDCVDVVILETLTIAVLVKWKLWQGCP